MGTHLLGNQHATDLPTTATEIGELFRIMTGANAGLYEAKSLGGSWAPFNATNSSAAQVLLNQNAITALTNRVVALENEYHIPTGTALPTTATVGDLFLLTGIGLHEALTTSGSWAAVRN